MRKLIYSMSVSLDGFIAGPGGNLDWGAPDEELFLFHTERVRGLGGHLCGRRLYEGMLFWETADKDPSASEAQVEFAHLWRKLPKIVFSKTLDRVEGSNYTLATEGVADVATRLKAEPGKDLEVGGAALAGRCAELGLIDEYQLFINPVVLGAGTPYFPPLEDRINLELVETRTFGSRVIYARYQPL
jgi:dihydrofolate reductase